MAVGFKENGLKTAALVMLAALTIALAAPSNSQAAVPPEQKEQIVFLYELRMAPEYCKWTDIGDISKLDAKIAEAEASLEITPEEKARFIAIATADVAKPETCTDGFARTMFDEAVK